MLVLLAACQTTPITATTKKADPVCLIWKEQSYSASLDSKPTVDEIRDKNAVRNKYCKGK